jgi:hypothetical protein
MQILSVFQFKIQQQKIDMTSTSKIGEEQILFTARHLFRKAVELMVRVNSVVIFFTKLPLELPKDNIN